MNPSDNKLKIAVFIDFDNVEIGVKTTIGGQFDIGVVLEAIKERGEIVTKIAYSDWKRVGDYSRLLTQHAIRMVQRNFTPGGDKNGADITMALDALEMAFTHAHINAFVIVGGDSDFISLVEKLKQYDRKVIVVGGRQFTSATMQKNCHEFIAYENLVATARAPQARQQGRGGRAATSGGSNIAQALPLIGRALKVLSEREVTPQLGLLKSTLLQLDSTFSERDYGAGSFRDFMEKVAEAGAVTLKHAGRSLLVEPREDGELAGDSAAAVAHADAGPGTEHTPVHAPVQPPASNLPQPDVEETEGEPVTTLPSGEGLRLLRHALSQGTPRWPMYVRQVKQFLKNALPGFDERKYGFLSVVDLLRAGQKEGVVRVERDRQGVMRVFAGTTLRVAASSSEPVQELGLPIIEEPEEVVQQDESGIDVEVPLVAEPVEDVGEAAPIIDVQPIPADDDTAPAADAEPAARKSSRGRKTARPGARKTARTPGGTRKRSPRVKVH